MCSGARVERPLVLWCARRTSTSEKKIPFASQGAYFQNITFPGPVEKGHRDVVNHMPWRSATRQCVHSVMLSCMTTLCGKQCVSTASTGLARRYRHGRALPRSIYPFRGAGRGLLRNPCFNRQTELTAKHLYKDTKSHGTYNFRYGPWYMYQVTSLLLQ